MGNDRMADIIKEAFDFAWKAHSGQFRKGTKTPYIVHIFDVMKYLYYEGAPEVAIVAGILHDVLEDGRKPDGSSFAKEDLVRFGPEVLRIVEFCTEPGNNPDVSEIAKKESWRWRKAHAITLLKKASRNKLLVSMADKLSNITAMKEDLETKTELWGRFNASRKDIKWYYESLLNSFWIAKDTRMYALFKRAVRAVF